MKANRRPNIFDLEKVTGLSRGTISRAFNGSKEISASTREMILRKAAEIGYTPHPGARTIKLGRTGRWGFLIPHLCNPWYSELTEAFNQECRKRNSMLLLGLSHYDPALEKEFVRYWAAGEVDGIIVTDSDMTVNYPVYQQIQEAGFPVVFLYASPHGAFDYVSFEVRDNTLRALRQLYGLGHRRIGYISKEFFHVRDTQNFRAYVQFHEEHGLELGESLLHFATNEYEAGPAAWKQWQKLPAPPTAAICAGDVIACNLVQFLLGSGHRIPQDFSVIGENDIADAARLKLTTIRTDRSAFAAAAFELLERPRGGAHPAMVTRKIESELILRDSIGSVHIPGT